MPIRLHLDGDHIVSGRDNGENSKTAQVDEQEISKKLIRFHEATLFTGVGEEEDRWTMCGP